MYASWYRIFLVVVLIALLGCSGVGGFVVTLTPEGTEGILTTVTSKPSIIYPTLTPTRELIITPTPEAMVCDETPVTIECKATVCIVRDSPSSGAGAIAYTVPNSTLLDGALSCRCETCAGIEQNWFYLGETDGQRFWAISMNKVWEKLKD